MELDSTVVEVDPIPDNTLKRILKVSFAWTVICWPSVDDPDT